MSQKRNFTDFLSAFIDYAKNDFAPLRFTRWTGLSILAGALERKVWLAEGNYKNYPNLFVLLVGGPGTGKSSAIRQGMPLLYGLQLANKYFKIVEGVTTAKGLRDTMNTFDVFPDNPTNVFSSAFLSGREGSDSPLKNHGDDFRSMACSMYDCEDLYQFTTGTDGIVTIPQPVMNLLVGTTYDFLGSVVDKNSVSGGLASRFTYVIQKKDSLKGNLFALDDEVIDAKNEAEKLDTKRRLQEDLLSVHRMTGRFRIERAAIDLCENWHNSFKEEFNAMESEKMRSLLIRKRTLLKKVLMLLSVSSGSDFSIRTAHAEKALTYVEEVTLDSAHVLSQAARVDKISQSGCTNLISQVLKENGGRMLRKRLNMAVIANGNNIDMATKTIDFMLGSGWIMIDGEYLKLLVDPDRYL